MNCSVCGNTMQERERVAYGSRCEDCWSDASADACIAGHTAMGALNRTPAPSYEGCVGVADRRFVNGKGLDELA